MWVYSYIVFSFRFNAIVRPLDAMKITSKSRTRKILLLTWIIPAVLASPYIYCKNMTFTIASELGMISRQICTDRFQEIDVMLYGIDALNSGAFRRGFFIFLFVVVYLIPLIIITTSCVSIAVCLLRPIVVEAERPPSLRKHTFRRHEENKRKVG